MFVAISKMLPTRSFIRAPLKFSHNCRDSRQNASNINLVTWEDVCETEKWEVEKVAERCVSDVLKEVEDLVGGEFREKSSCSVIPLMPKTPKDLKLTEDRRLKNWNRWLQIHERESYKLTRSTYRRRKDLLLNLNHNEFRLIRNRKEILEKLNDGIGDVNFWKIPEKSSKELYFTTPKSSKVDPPQEVVYTQTPDLTLKEQRIVKAKETPPLVKLFDDKIEQQIGVIYDPDMDHLALKGNAFNDGCGEDPRKSRSTIDSIQLSSRVSRVKKADKRQALVIGGIKVDNIFPDKNILVDLVFEGFKFQRETKSVRLENCGEIAINLTLKKTQDDPDEVFFRRSPKMFFFNRSTFRIIPGEIVDFQYHFYPNQAGLFQEKWIVVCSPAFSDQCDICINLVGQCNKKYKQDDELMKIENEIVRRAAEYDVEKAIKDLIELSVKESKPPHRLLFKDPSEDAFTKINPKLFYQPELVDNLMQVYTEACENESKWNFDIEALYQLILNMKNQDKQKELYNKFIKNFNQLRNAPQSHISDDEKPAKFSMIRNTFGLFFEKFEDVMNDGSPRCDREITIKQNFYSTINKIIPILES